MNDKHTPEPWDGDFTPKRDVSYALSSPDKDGIRTVIFSGYGLRAKADIGRAVACVNACKGINPEAVPEIVKCLRGFVLNRTHLGDPELASVRNKLVDLSAKALAAAGVDI
jgi:hypothetical protein